MRFNRMMVLAGVIATLFFAQTAMALPETVNFSNAPGGSILFVGDGTSSTFSFPPNGPGANDFKITGESNFSAPGSLIGLLGEIQGTFSFTAASIQTNGSLETAPVTGTGTYIIHDGLGQDLTAVLVWDDIQTFLSFGTANTTAQVNLSSFSYSGSNAQLMELAATGGGSVSANFQFIPTRDLKTLASTTCSGASNPCSTSFNGTLTAAPEATQGGFLLIGLLAAFGIVRRFRTA